MRKTVLINYYLVVVIAFLICSMDTMAQKTNRSETASVKNFMETVAQAQTKTDAKQWAEAAALWAQVVAVNPIDGRFWNQLARARYNAKDYRGSISAYEKLITLGDEVPAGAAYNIACDYALLGEKEAALTWLEKAFAMGFPSLPDAQTDQDLKSIRDVPRYRNLVGLIDVSKMSRTEGWRTDLRLLVREIKRKGYHLFPRTGTETNFDASVKKLDDSIPQLSDAQLIVEFAKLLRKVGDGHSGLLGGRRQEFLQNLPIQLYLFEEGLFIIAADPKYKDLIGAQILRFGNRTPDEIVKGLEPIINRDNEIWIKQVAPYRMRNLNILNGLGLVSDTDKVLLKVRGLDGKERVVIVAVDNTQPDIWNVKPNPPGWINLSQTLPQSVPLYLKNPATPYWFEFLPNEKTVYFGFNSVRNDPKEPLAAFSDRLSKFIDENGVEKLVIDLRWNNGGNTMLLSPLVQKLIGNEKINRRGHLFVIIGRRTFSAAQNAATFFERQTNAIFVGEPTGSSPNFVGEEDPFTLPYSKIIVNVSDLYWESSYPQDKRIWIAPQIFLPPTFADYVRNGDSVMEAILAYR